jgi:hypothetical protein
MTGLLRAVACALTLSYFLALMLGRPHSFLASLLAFGIMAVLIYFTDGPGRKGTR